MANDDVMGKILEELSVPGGTKPVAPAHTPPPAAGVSPDGLPPPPIVGGVAPRVVSASQGRSAVDPNLVQHLIKQLQAQLPPEAGAREKIQGEARTREKIMRHLGLLLDPDGGVGLSQIEDVRAQGGMIDEVQKYLLDKERAARDAGGDEFRTFIKMQEGHRERLSAQLATASGNPLSVAGSVLGNQVTLASGESQEVANWVGSDDETQTVTVVLAPVTINPYIVGIAPVVTPARPYATVYFGTRGFMISVDVDLGQGCIFTVNASTVRIGFTMPPVLPGLTPLTLNLTGMLSFRNNTRTTPVTRTTYWDQAVVTLGALAVSQVPNFAKSVTIYTPNSPNTTKMSFQFEDSNGQAIASGEWVGGSNNPANFFCGPMLLPPETGQILVGNGGGDTLPSVRFVYDLAL